MHVPEIRIRSWMRGTLADRRAGLLGYVDIVVSGLRIDGVTMRVTADGRLSLSFPSRINKRGERQAIVRPLDDRARRAIEAAVLSQLAQLDDLGIGEEADHD